MIPDIVVAGHLCLDMFPDMSHLPAQALVQGGKLYETGPLRYTTGGAVGNTGLALHRLGVRVGLLTSIGDDYTGDVILSLLKRASADLTADIRRRSDRASACTIVLTPQGQDRIFLTHTGTNQVFSRADINFDVVRQAKIFHLGYPPVLPELIRDEGAELAEAFWQAKTAGVVTSLDMSLPDAHSPSAQVNWRAILANVLPHVDVFVPSIEEALFTLRRADYEAWSGDILTHLSRDYLAALAEEVLMLGAGVAGFKLGALGMYLQTTADAARLVGLARLGLDVEAWRGSTHHHPAFDVLVAGTTGAGDCAFAGLLTALLHGCDPAEALRMACAVGACSVEGFDATGNIPAWEAVQARVAAGWALRPRRLG